MRAKGGRQAFPRFVTRNVLQSSSPFFEIARWRYALRSVLVQQRWQPLWPSIERAPTCPETSCSLQSLRDRLVDRLQDRLQHLRESAWVRGLTQSSIVLWRK